MTNTKKTTKATDVSHFPFHELPSRLRTAANRVIGNPEAYGCVWDRDDVIDDDTGEVIYNDETKLWCVSSLAELTELRRGD